MSEILVPRPTQKAKSRFRFAIWIRPVVDLRFRSITPLSRRGKPIGYRAPRAVRDEPYMSSCAAEGTTEV